MPPLMPMPPHLGQLTIRVIIDLDDILTPVSPSVLSPNQAARNSELQEAKLSAKDVIAREIFKVDTGATASTGHDEKVMALQSLKNSSTDEEEFVLRPGTKSIQTDGSKVATEVKESNVSNKEAIINKGLPDVQSDIQSPNELEVMKNSLKRVEVAPMMRKGLPSDTGEEQSTTASYNTSAREQEPKNTDKLTSSVLIGSNIKQQDNTSVPSPLNKSSNVTIDKLKTSSHPSPSSSTVADSQNITTNNLKSDKDNDIVSTSKSTRIIPIKIERDMTKLSESQSNVSDIPTTSSVPKDNSVKESRKGEHYIPIMVEGKGMINNAPITSQISKEDQDEANEKFDSFHSNSLSRRRLGSRKKRMSSAYSDSSGISEEGSELGGAAFSGLQRFSSLGKHGLEENIPVLKLRKTRPPFTMQRSDSCSSGEDDFDDDGFREMTAENLFSTLLTRVKSLTRRIHDEHESDLEKSFRQNQRILNHPLNPGGTHARLERSLQRNSIKREKPPNLSRQSSTEAASRYSTYDDGASSVKSYGGGSVRGENDSGSTMTTAELMRKYGSSQGGGRDDAGSVYSSQSLQRGTTNPNWSDTESIYSESSKVPQSTSYVPKVQAPKRYELSSTSILPDANIINDAGNDFSSNITSRHKLRPGYLPPPILSSSETDPLPTLSNTVSVDGGADGVRLKHSSSISTTTSFSVPITSHVEHVRDNNNKQHEISSKISPNELKNTYNINSTSAKHNFESSSSLSNPSSDFSNQKSEKTVDYPSSIYVKKAKPFTNPPPLPMKTEINEYQPEKTTNFKHGIEYNTNKQRANNEIHSLDGSHKAEAQPLILNMHVSTTKNDNKEKQNTTEEQWEPSKSIFAKSVHPRKLVGNEQIDSSSPIKPNLTLSMPPVTKAKEDVLVAAGMLSPQPKVNPHEATKKLENQMKNNLTSPSIPSEGQFLARALTLRKQNNNNSQSINSTSIKQSSSATISTSSSTCDTTTSTSPTSTESARPTTHATKPSFDISSNSFKTPSASRSQSISIPISSASSNKIVINPTQEPTTTKPHFVPQPVVVKIGNRKRNSIATPSNTLPNWRTQNSKPFSNSSNSNPTSAAVVVNSPPFSVTSRPITPQLDRRTAYFDSPPESVTSGSSSPLSSSQPQKSRRVILPYGGAKSDGLLNQHAFISCNVIAAAERRKRDPPSLFNKSTTSELPLEKVNFQYT